MIGHIFIQIFTRIFYRFVHILTQKFKLLINHFNLKSNFLWQLLSHKHTRLLGLIYLRTASEELATPREDLPIQRKNELFRFLSAQVPLTLDSLTSTAPYIDLKSFISSSKLYNYYFLIQYF